jgi:hypothetical protein
MSLSLMTEGNAVGVEDGIMTGTGHPVTQPIGSLTALGVVDEVASRILADRIRNRK